MTAPELEGKNIRVNNKRVTDISQLEIDWFLLRGIMGELSQYCTMTRFLTKTEIGRRGWRVSATKLVSLYYTLGRDSPFADKRQWKKY